MSEKIPKEILPAYGLSENSLIISFGNGLINRTWKVENEKGSYILQLINTDVFKSPYLIAENVQNVGDFLSDNYPGYFFCKPLKTLSGDDLLFVPEKGYYRLFPFVKNSRSADVVTNTKQAYEAAKKFGEFTRLLSGFPVNELHTTLENFHNLLLRYTAFTEALLTGGEKRIKKSAELINFLKSQKYIVDEFENIRQNNAFRLRVTHHDTKISNVLFDKEDNGICVIDLDTIMPGYFISDVGDMMRTYLSPEGEEESDLSKLQIREEYFAAVVKGYLHEMQQQLTVEEKQCFVYAGKFMLYMQALRFLTDHLNNDIYYGSAYEGHNFIRAQNQAYLLQLLNKKEPVLTAIVHKTINTG